MRCKYSRMLCRYIDEELSIKDREFIKSHLGACLYCQNEVKNLGKIKEGLKTNRIKSDPQEFWNNLIPFIREEDIGIGEESVFSFNIGLWSKRLMPVPVAIAAIVIIFMNLNFTNKNLVDEYIFGSSFNKAISLLSDNSAGLGL